MRGCGGLFRRFIIINVLDVIKSDEFLMLEILELLIIDFFIGIIYEIR